MAVIDQADEGETGRGLIENTIIWLSDYSIIRTIKLW